MGLDGESQGQGVYCKVLLYPPGTNDAVALLGTRARRTGSQDERLSVCCAMQCTQDVFAHKWLLWEHAAPNGHGSGSCSRCVDGLAAQRTPARSLHGWDSEREAVSAARRGADRSDGDDEWARETGGIAIDQMDGGRKAADECPLAKPRWVASRVDIALIEPTTGDGQEAGDTVLYCTGMQYGKHRTRRPCEWCLLPCTTVLVPLVMAPLLYSRSRWSASLDTRQEAAKMEGSAKLGSPVLAGVV
ncbi:hypothetical protein MRB53_039949 [Persea americana]|nr:hypothetical protein MRB53_039949 [Persea americana]